MAFRSRFSGGKCSRCPNPILKGQEISWTRTGEQKAYWHLSCEAAGLPIIAQSAPVVSQGSPALAIEPAQIIEPVEPKAPALSIVARKPQTVAHGADSILDLIFEGLKDRLGSLEASKTDSAEFQELKARTGEAIRDLAAKLDSNDKWAFDEFLKVNDKLKALESRKSEPLTVELKGPSTSVVISNAHKQVPMLASAMSQRFNVYLWDSTGGGKTFAVRQVATEMGLSYAAQSFNRQSPAYLILGYMDAVGKYVESVFYKKYKFGGVFVGEELDDASADLLVTLNVGIDNGHMTFPNGEEVERHPDFVFVGCGNTAGRGASPRYPERKPFDAAFANRMLFIRWEYDETLEETVTLSINPEAREILAWVREARAEAARLSLRLEITPRTSFTLARLTLDKTVSDDALIHSVMAGIDQPSIDKLLANVPFPARKLSK